MEIVTVWQTGLLSIREESPQGVEAFTQALTELPVAYLGAVVVLLQPRLMDQNMRIMFSCFADSEIFILCPIELAVLLWKLITGIHHPWPILFLNTIPCERW